MKTKFDEVYELSNSEEYKHFYYKEFYRILEENTMNIYVLRHGQTDYNVKNIYQGQTDIPLNEVGIKQAKDIAQKFKNINLDAILVSPLTRAKQTAEFVSKITNIPITINEGLIERSFGDMEGQPNREDCNIEMLLDYDKNYDICNVEPIQELFKRVHNCMDKIVEVYKNRDVLLVTHAGVAQAIECYFNGLPKNKDIAALTLPNGEVRKYVVLKKRSRNKKVSE